MPTNFKMFEEKTKAQETKYETLGILGQFNLSKDLVKIFVIWQLNIMNYFNKFKMKAGFSCNDK